ncbi:NF-kappa-B inhibitor zeta isoform X2 [Heptranchias perlo]|uniref:NF-kappa-B inhibitor zeta isoform X2 n=1 Tax=Heptranchias perlo TaxID=212740 RepID=UPI003559B400
MKRDIRRVRGELHNQIRFSGKSFPESDKEDMTWKSSNVRRRVVRDVVHGHPYAAGRARQIKKPIAYLPKNFEELLEDLVEVLETDLKQGKMCSDQTVQGPVEMDCQAGCYIGCPVSLWGSHYSSQHPMLQTDQGALHSYQSYFSKDGATRPDLESASPEPYSHSESESWDLSPVHLLAFADEHCGNTSDRAFNCHPCYSQNIMEQSFPRSPSPEAKRFSQAALNIIQSSKSSHIDSKDHPVSPQQQLLPDNSAMSFFQFQLRHVEWSLSTMSTQEILSVDKNGNLMLHNAVIQGKRALAYSLACRMANMGRIDAKDTRGRTALHLAAERNQHLMVNDLISLGAQINYKDYLGKTPVHLCAENGFLRVLQAIEKTLMNGTDVDIDAMDNNYLTPLHCAVLAHSATVKEFENSDLDGNMEKFLTLRKDQLLDGMKCLLRMGASLSRQDMNGRSAIHFAVEESDTEVLNFLYSHVGKIKTDLHKEFGSFAVLGVMDQKADLQVVVPELLPCDIPSRPAMRCEELGLRLSIGCQ